MQGVYRSASQFSLPVTRSSSLPVRIKYKISLPANLVCRLGEIQNTRYKKRFRVSSFRLRNKIQISIDSRLFFGGWSGLGLGRLDGR